MTDGVAMRIAAHFADEVQVDWGKLLESQLERWHGGGSHGGGIAEYISNSDDSYRRLRQFSGQQIEVEIHSMRGRHIDRLVIRDFAEGMSYNDLENKFFRYFESASGREQGKLVSGRFGTGGKAYAIMNFRHCWITSAKDGLENKAWFKWDTNRKRIVRGYDAGGYKNQGVEKPNQTIVALEHSLKVNGDLMELVASLERLPRIRHVVRNQQITVQLYKKRERVDLVLRYLEPQDPAKVWTFPVPEELCNGEKQNPPLTLRYFQRPLGEENFVDLSDGISSVADEKLDRFDRRPFSKYFNGSLTLARLRHSSAVKENRKGLEEGDDLTRAIEAFVRQCVCTAVSEVEDEQRRKERERRLSASNEKMKELSKFIRKCDTNFKRELKELEERAVIDPTQHSAIVTAESDQPVWEHKENGTAELQWKESRDASISSEEAEGSTRAVSQVISEEDGSELANKLASAWGIWSKTFPVAVEKRPNKNTERRKACDELRVLLSDDPSISDEDRRVFGEFDDPVSDCDMINKGIIWINANHPTIVDRRTRSENDPVFLEMVANYVLMVAAQYHAQRQYDAEPDEEKSEPLLLFRQKFFKFQRDLRQDDDVTYFDIESTEDALFNPHSAKR